MPCHVGRGRVAARAHPRAAGQLLGREIAHAARESSPVCALMVGVVVAPLGAGKVALPGSTNHPAPDLGATAWAVALPAVAATAEREHRAAFPTENKPKIVQVPTPDSALLAIHVAVGDGPSVCVPTRQGRPGVSPLGLLPFLPAGPVDDYAVAARRGTIRRTPVPIPTDRRGQSQRSRWGPPGVSSAST